MLNNSLTWSDIKHFKASEFDSPDEPGSGTRMNLAFVAKLDKLREAVSIPLIINSGYRTWQHNASRDVGGVESSAHVSGHAADILADTSQTRYKILEAAFKIGFRRVGVANTFIHLDDAIDKPQDCCWTYPSK